MKTVVWILAGILTLAVLVVMALQFHVVQRYIAQKLLSSISEKTHSRIEVGSVNLAFSHSVVLRNIFVEGRQKDTLLSIQSLAADVNLLRLFSHEIKLNNVRIDSLNAHITRTLPDSSFNFDFILNALGPDSTSAYVLPDTSAGPDWVIRPGGVSLNGIHVTYDDEVSGINLRLQLGTLEASIDKFDLDKNQFHVDNVSLTNTTASIIQTKETPSGESQASDIGFGSLSLENVHFNYQNVVSGERYVVDLGTSTLLADRIDLPSHHIALRNFLLENTNIVIVTQKKKENGPETADASTLPWVFSLDHLILKENSAQYDVQGAAKIKGIDPNHIRLGGVTLRAENMYFSENRMTANISHSSFREYSGLELRELSGGFILDSVHARLTDFTVETAASQIHQNILLSYTSLSAFKNLAGAVHVQAIFHDSHVAISDLLFFQPSLPLRNTPGSSIRFSSKLSGLVQDLRVEEFRASAGESTRVDFTGSIRGFPNAKTAFYDINLHLISSGRNDIQGIVTDSLLPKNLVLPAWMRMSGDFKGTAKNFSASADIATNIGSIRGNAALNSVPGVDSIAGQWKTDIIVEEFDVGSLLDDPETFGPVSLKATAVGTGVTKDDINARVNVQVDKAVVKGYPYRGLTIEGIANSTMFGGKAEIRDTSIAFTFNGIVNTSEENPNYKFTLDLKGADLRRLNLTPDDIRVSGILTSDLTGADISSLNGNIGARNVVIIKNRNRYVIDSLVCALAGKGDQAHISIESTIFAAQLDGTIAPGSLPQMLKEHFAHYFASTAKQTATNLKAQDFRFQITLRDPATLTDVFFPDLHKISSGTIAGNFSSATRALNVNIDIPRIDYGDFKIDSLTVKITSDADLLQATLSAGSIADSTIRITNLQLMAKARHDSIDLALQSTGTDGSMKMLLAGVFNSAPDGYTFRFNKDGIVFHDFPWTVPSDNYLSFGNNRLVAHNITMRGAAQSVSLSSTEEKNQRSPLRIEFKEFDLATLSQVVERESGLLGGILNGNVILQNLDKQMAFTSDLTIKDFSFEQRHVGDISLRANDQTENLYDVNLNISGNGNQIVMQGKYRSQEGTNELDLTCDFTKVNLASLEPFTFGTVNRLSGTMTGGLHLTGTTKKPSMSGNLNFINTAFTPTFLDTYLHLNNGKVTIDKRGIEFSSFDLTDTLGNVAALSGRLLTEDFRTYSYDFRAHTDKFLLLNKPPSRNALYYGTVILNSDITVKGDQRRPIVNIQAELAKGTNLALVLPESELAVEERRGIVRFVNVKAIPNSIMSQRNVRRNRDTTQAELSSIDLTSNITVTKDSRLRILIDPVSGDSLVIHGEATLSFTMDPSGKLALTGRYEIVEGSYQLSFGDFIKREFTIAKGSSITWFGSPVEADVDITAIYTVKASVLELIQDQLAGISQEERNKYRQELPIQVYLMMKGKLLKPDIHFKLDLPPDKRGVLNGTVYAKLNELNGQESELNKQVFALLVMGRFIPQNPLASSSGNVGVSDLARSSASQILSAQLNRLSEQYIAGANLNVGVDSYQDYSTGSAEGRTQLKLALSKQLFDERVTVQVGGNVDLEGRRSQENSLNNFAGDLKVLYKLTDDGRWQLQVFRQNSYEGAIDGDITKTGVGIVFTIDFDRLYGLMLKPVPDQKEK